MKSTEVWEQYREYTEALSENCRKLGFAAVAICWVFKGSGVLPAVQLPASLLLALGLVSFYFLFDVAQYAVASALIGGWMRRQERSQWHVRGVLVEEVEKPAWIDAPVATLFWGKLVLIVLTYLAIAFHAIGRAVVV
ncbi:hypothetical protein [Engelhardtia mirabilis]|uniref:Uncharacterized protein n=1 Tax=Engelhardtia mirabilis TaxID=2528011 RepID=A0A518BHR1_9BACT|nr:hypothetical protein Pla133_15680 [Planctomycetes bacterium Pla133]QDV00820.1 hypothetical protein Pla86_15670 [Planctomycetes bacterium Pla86]